MSKWKRRVQGLESQTPVQERQENSIVVPPKPPEEKSAPEVPTSVEDFETALESERLAVFRQWIRSGFDVNHWFQNGFRPLHLIARRFSDQAARGADTSFLLAVARLFLESKASPNVRATPVGTTGITPLHIAYSPVDKPLATLLFAHGADGSIKDNFGRTPAELQKLDVENLRASGCSVTEESEQHVEFLSHNMTELARLLSKIICVIKVKTGEEGKLSEAVTAGMIADALKDQFDIALDKKKFSLSTPFAPSALTKWN